jgi:DNA repair exonuclease SbcCD ATPase subunit
MKARNLYFCLLVNICSVEKNYSAEPFMGSAFFNASLGSLWQGAAQGMPTLLVLGLYKIASSATVQEKVSNLIEIEGSKSIIGRLFGSISGFGWNCVETFSRNYFLRPSKVKKAKREAEIAANAQREAESKMLYQKIDENQEELSYLRKQSVSTQEFLQKQNNSAQEQNADLVKVIQEQHNSLLKTTQEIHSCKEELSSLQERFQEQSGLTKEQNILIERHFAASHEAQQKLQATVETIPKGQQQLREYMQEQNKSLVKTITETISGLFKNQNLALEKHFAVSYEGQQKLQANVEKNFIELSKRHQKLHDIVEAMPTLLTNQNVVFEKSFGILQNGQQKLQSAIISMEEKIEAFSADKKKLTQDVALISHQIILMNQFLSQISMQLNTPQHQSIPRSNSRGGLFPTIFNLLGSSEGLPSPNLSSSGHLPPYQPTDQ